MSHFQQQSSSKPHTFVKLEWFHTRRIMRHSGRLESYIHAWERTVITRLGSNFCRVGNLAPHILSRVVLPDNGSKWMLSAQFIFTIITICSDGWHDGETCHTWCFDNYAADDGESDDKWCSAVTRQQCSSYFSLSVSATVALAQSPG